MLFLTVAPSLMMRFFANFTDSLMRYDCHSVKIVLSVTCLVLLACRDWRAVMIPAKHNNGKQISSSPHKS